MLLSAIFPSPGKRERERNMALSFIVGS